MDNQKLLAFNQDQVKHIQMVQQNVLTTHVKLNQNIDLFAVVSYVQTR